MRPRHILLLGCTPLCCMTLAQGPPSVQWEVSYGGGLADVPGELVRSADGGYVLAGMTLSQNDGDVTGNHSYSGDVWVIKLSASGALLWQRSLGGTHGDEAYCAVATPDNGVIIGGMTDSNDHDALGCVSQPRSWVMKLDSLGGVVWKNCENADPVHDIELTSDGGCIAVSSFSDVNVTKLDASGATEWTQSYGGPGSDHANAIEVSSDGGFLVAGRTDQNGGDVSGNHGATDLWLLRLDAAGALQWQSCLGGSAQDLLGDLVRTNDGNYLLTGTTDSMDGDVDATSPDQLWVVKLDDQGGIIWQQCRPFHVQNHLTALIDGSFLCTGILSWSDVSLERWDAAGDVLWQVSHATNSSYVANALPTEDGGIAWATGAIGFDWSVDNKLIKLGWGGLAEAINEQPVPFNIALDTEGHLLHILTTRPCTDGALDLLDGSGRLLERSVLRGTKGTMAISGLAKGVYVVRLRMDGRVYNKAVMVV